MGSTIESHMTEDRGQMTESCEVGSGNAEVRMAKKIAESLAHRVGRRQMKEAFDCGRQNVDAESRGC